MKKMRNIITYERLLEGYRSGLIKAIPESKSDDGLYYVHGSFKVNKKSFGGGIIEFESGFAGVNFGSVIIKGVHIKELPSINVDGELLIEDSTIDKIGKGLKVEGKILINNSLIKDRINENSYGYGIEIKNSVIKKSSGLEMVKCYELLTLAGEDAEVKKKDLDSMEEVLDIIEDIAIKSDCEFDKENRVFEGDLVLGEDAGLKYIPRNLKIKGNLIVENNKELLTIGNGFKADKVIIKNSRLYRLPGCMRAKELHIKNAPIYNPPGRAMIDKVFIENTFEWDDEYECMDLKIDNE